MFTSDPITPLHGSHPDRYRLVDGTDLFEIGETSGIVRARVQLDRERAPSHALRVEVRDAGDPVMTATVTAHVDVRDVNDNPSEPRDVGVTVYIVKDEFAGGAFEN